MKTVSAVAVAVLAAGPAVAVTPGAAAESTQPTQPTMSAAASGDAFLAMSVPDIRARVRKANRTKMSKRDRQCRDHVQAQMPKWWGPSGHTVICRPGRTNGYDFWFDGVAVLTVNSKLSPKEWDQSVDWAASKVGRTERIPLSQAPALCRKATKEFAGLARKAGKYRVRCVEEITWKIPDKTTKDMSILGYIHYGKRDIAILETRDVNSMKLVTAHELGHAVSVMPKAKGLQREVTRYAKRRSFTSGPYVGMPAEIWAESFARYWTKQYKVASVQKKRMSVTQVDQLLRRYGLPRR